MEDYKSLEQIEETIKKLDADEKDNRERRFKTLKKQVEEEAKLLKFLFEKSYP
jgi:hypothetical protein